MKYPLKKGMKCSSIFVDSKLSSHFQTSYWSLQKFLVPPPEQLVVFSDAYKHVLCCDFSYLWGEKSFKLWTSNKSFVTYDQHSDWTKLTSSLHAYLIETPRSRIGSMAAALQTTLRSAPVYPSDFSAISLNSLSVIWWLSLWSSLSIISFLPWMTNEQECRHKYNLTDLNKKGAKMCTGREIPMTFFYLF